MGILDRCDKMISRPIFHLTLPRFAEVLLTVPGVWFGCPLYALGVVPLMATAVPTPHFSKIHGLSLPVCLLSSCYWFKACWKSLQTGEGLKAIYALGFQPWSLLVPNLAMAAAANMGNKDCRRLVGNYLSSWYLVQLFLEAVKNYVGRLRPGVALKEELDPVPRGFSELRSLVAHPSQANSSFPSGDAAGSAAFATALSISAPHLHGIGIGIACLSGFGRVYFHYHHILDVLVGQLCGMGMTMLVNKYVDAKWYHVLGSQLLLVLLWKPLQRWKSFEKNWD